jgi:adenine deaminase
MLRHLVGNGAQLWSHVGFRRPTQFSRNVNSAFRCKADALEGGRVLDPASRRDEKLNIGIRDGRIAALTSDALEGDREIDAEGRMVVPGFIDQHSPTPFPFGELFQR